MIFLLWLFKYNCVVPFPPPNPLNLITIQLRVFNNFWTRYPISFKHMPIQHMLLHSHITTHCSHEGDKLRQITKLGMYIYECKGWVILYIIQELTATTLYWVVLSLSLIGNLCLEEKSKNKGFGLEHMPFGRALAKCRPTTATHPARFQKMSSLHSWRPLVHKSHIECTSPWRPKIQYTCSLFFSSYEID